MTTAGTIFLTTFAKAIIAVALVKFKKMRIERRARQ